MYLIWPRSDYAQCIFIIGRLILAGGMCCNISCLIYKHGCIYISYIKPLDWRHNGRDSVSNHQPHDCLLNRLIRRRSKKTSKLRVTGLCAGNSLVTGEFPHKWPVTQETLPFNDVIMHLVVFSVWWYGDSRWHSNKLLVRRYWIKNIKSIFRNQSKRFPKTIIHTSNRIYEIEYRSHADCIL